ncbi:MAG: ATP-dependent Clp protease proteolytic subunit [Porticoccaceae bacterium]|jgi:ATP-dependent Clp protease protease subunit|nr:ATP-dependent Clp protease proteolytic subunit [Porticoccaceae bacterium]|tara:strand:- start:1562 stop:2152 length:591 start_codon:yes stop_codon:yes gene_type:complete
MPFPAFIENTRDGEKAYDVYTRMLKDRIVFLTGVVREEMANHLVAQLLLLESQNDKAPIIMYVNSPGGSVTHGMSIYDTMQYITSPIHTVVIGQAASMASLLACSGAHRSITTNSRHMIHQPLGGASGQATDVLIHANELVRWKEVLTSIYQKHTGQDYDKLVADMERDNYMTAEQAKEYNLVDIIVENRVESTTD